MRAHLVPDHDPAFEHDVDTFCECNPYVYNGEVFDLNAFDLVLLHRPAAARVGATLIVDKDWDVYLSRRVW